jgi:CDGSH-type Zn-finger protein
VDEPATITPYRDGPYIVRGNFAVMGQDGTPIETHRKTIALCRCGKSQIRPFCDGTHKVVGFRAAGSDERLPEVEPPVSAGPVGGWRGLGRDRSGGSE